MIRVLVADAHPAVRDGLRVLLEARSDMEVVGMAATGGDALHLAAALQPDVVIVDVALPGLEGVVAPRQIHDACARTRVIVLSMHATMEYIVRALEAGACGYLLADTAGTHVVDAIRTVHAGQRYLSGKIPAAAIDDRIVERSRTGVHGSARLD